MRRHTPTLYPHVENDDDLDDDQPHPYPSPPRGSVSGRMLARSRSTFTGTPVSQSIASSSTTIGYAQYLKRYRSDGDGGMDDRHDPDSHYFRKDLDQFDDAGDTDDEQWDTPAFNSSNSDMDWESGVLMLESEPIEPQSQGERERLKWLQLLSHVLGGEVLKSEKTRIADVLKETENVQENVNLQIWSEIRARLHGRSVEEEGKKLAERRLRTVDPVISEIINFRVPPGTDATTAIYLVSTLLRRLDFAQSLYPSLRLFYSDKPLSQENAFQKRRDALNTWLTTITSARRQIARLQRWTGSETLDVTQPNTSAEIPIAPTQGRSGQDGSTEIADSSNFVERVLKEESMQRMFERGFLVTVHEFVQEAQNAQITLAPMFREMNLPLFEQEVAPFISFPTNLAQAALHVRLDYVQKFKDPPEVMIIDQMTEDLKLSIGLACTIKRQYQRFLAPHESGNWNLPQCINEDYDSSILESMDTFFKLIHWKFKSGAKSIYLQETDVLEVQWGTFNDVALCVAGGSCLVAEQLWYVRPIPFVLFLTCLRLSQLSHK